MSRITKAVHASLATMPAKLFRNLLAEKLKAQGMEPLPELVDKLADHLLANEAGEFMWDAPGDDRHVVLHFGPEDGAALEQKYKDVFDALPDIILNATDRTCESMVKSMRARWPAEQVLQDAEMSRFRAGLELRWGEGLDYLRMLLTAAREIGQGALSRHGRSKSKRRRYRRWTLGRLHARACQVTEEVICLLENGLADGAFARWRTLHELSIVATLIADGDEDLAERYIAHDAVELKKQADDFQSSQVPLGAAPISSRRLAAIDRDYSRALTQFGDEFRHPYGWAAKHLAHKKPTFKELQAHAARSAASSHYKLASFNVHAGARSMFFNLGSILDEHVVLAGRSNAGLAEPGCLTAYALTLITGLYSSDTPNLDRTIDINALVRLRNLAESAFRRSERALNRDERELRERATKRTKETPRRKGK